MTKCLGIKIFFTIFAKSLFISYERMRKIYTNMEGNEGARPFVIAEKLASDSSIPREHLILVTNGGVSQSNVERCDQILQNNNIHFKYVTSYIIGIGANLSVDVPFTRGCSSKTIEVHPNHSRRVHIKNFLDQIDNINSLDQFKRYSKALFKATIQKVLGTEGDKSLQFKFEELKNRLMKENRLDAKTDHILSTLIEWASGGLRNVFDSTQLVAMEDDAND